MEVGLWAGGRRRWGRVVSLKRGLSRRERRAEHDWRTRQQVTETLKKMDVSVTWKWICKCVSVSNGPRRKLRWDAFIHSLRVTCGSKLAPVSFFFFFFFFNMFQGSTWWLSAGTETNLWQTQWSSVFLPWTPTSLTLLRLLLARDRLKHHVLIFLRVF